MPLGLRLSTEEKAQIRALHEAGLSNDASPGVRSYLSDPEAYDNRDALGHQRKLSSKAEREIWRGAPNSTSSVNQIRVDLKLSASKTMKDDE
nr:unnamed protein product [Haemonchus contortus]